MPQLRTIVFSHGRTNIPAYALYNIFINNDTAFPNPVDVYVPPSVTSVDANAVSAENIDKITIRGMAGSYVESAGIVRIPAGGAGDSSATRVGHVRTAVFPRSAGKKCCAII
jgi:hypothetical protein